MAARHREHCGSMPRVMLFLSLLMLEGVTAFSPVVPSHLGSALAGRNLCCSSGFGVGLRFANHGAQAQRRALKSSSSLFGAPATFSMKLYNVQQSVVPEACPKDGVAVVLFTGYGDLRVHDHPGLEAAASASRVHAIYVFDPQQITGMTDRQVKLLVSSVEDLQTTLESLSISLDIRVGDLTAEVRNAANDVSATHVYVHEQPTDKAQTALSKARAGAVAAGAQIVRWNAALRSGLETLSDDFYDYRKRLGVGSASFNSLSPSRESLATRLTISAKEEEKSEQLPRSNIDLSALLAEVRSLTDESMRIDVERLGAESSVGDREEGGETVALELWERYKEDSVEEFATAVLGGSWAREEGEKKRGMEILALPGVASLFEGETFVRAFRELMALGCISPRLINRDVTDLLWRSRPLRLGMGSEAKKMRVARDAVEGGEWHRVLAMVDAVAEETREDKEAFAYKYWKWKGHHVRYAEGGKEDGEALVLVHGFGASADQWERVMVELGRDHRVYAIDKLGFGHSEKPEVTYTQYLWERNVEDFIVEVVGRPCFLAGNSIGGYTALCAAAGLKSCRGLILINSAGRMLPREEYAKEKTAMGGTLKEVMEADGLPPKQSPPQWFLDGAGNVAISLLRSNVEGFCKQVYPNFPEMVDDRLVYNIIRDSKDPGGYSVLASGAKLPPPRTKNELLEEFRRPLLVTQGLNDPLGGGISKTRFALYSEVHPEPGMVRLAGLESGHCPHHETPDQVSTEVRSFVKEVVAGRMRAAETVESAAR